MSSLFSRFVIVIVLLAPLSASAASPFGNRPAEIDLSNTYHPPKLFISDTVVSQQTNEAISGSFALHNTEAYPLNALYRFEIFGPLPADIRRQYGLSDDTTVLHHRSPAVTISTLAAGQKRSIPFNFTLPPLPAGAYTLRMQSLTATGRALGWGDVSINKTTGDENFTYVYPGKIAIPEYKELLGPLTGPNVSPSARFTLHGTAQNPSDQSLKVTPRLIVYRFDSARTHYDTVLLPAITLPPRHQQSLSLPVTAAAEPGVYFAELTLLDEQQTARSTVAEYRWVVRGASADIIVAAPLRLDSNQKRAAIRLEFVGPADAETKLDNASIRLTLEDQGGVIGTHTINDLSLNDAIQGGQAAVALDRAPKKFLRLTAAVQDKDQAVIFQHTETFAASLLPGRTTFPLTRLVVITVVAGLLFLIYLLKHSWFKRRRGRDGGRRGR